jgi:hypothetical protein
MEQEDREPVYKIRVEARKDGCPWPLPAYVQDFGHALTARKFDRMQAKRVIGEIQAGRLRQGKRAHLERGRFANLPALVIQEAGNIEYRLVAEEVGATGS